MKAIIPLPPVLVAVVLSYCTPISLPGQVVTTHQINVSCLITLPTGVIVSGSWDGTVSLWDWSGNNIRTLKDSWSTWIQCLCVYKKHLYLGFG